MYFHIIFLWCVVLNVRVDALKLSSVSRSFTKGLKAYNEERWSECINQFEESLHLYQVYRSTVTNCRSKCNNLKFETVIKDNIGDLQIYEHFINKRNCLRQCQQKAFEDATTHDQFTHVIHKMQARIPYQYLHMCYFEMNMITKAASAAYTFFTVHQDDKTMKENLNYYIQLSEVDVNEIKDHLVDDYVTHLKHGFEAYNQNNWATTILDLEESLADYISSENMCRVECEFQPQQETSLEFTFTITKSIASLLHCYQHCQEKLKSLGYNSGLDFLGDTLNYLQISYYHLEDYKNAAKAVSTYLLLLPEDETMLENKKIYSKLTDSKYFINRSDIVHYFKRDKYEKALLNAFDKNDTIY